MKRYLAAALALAILLGACSGAPEEEADVSSKPGVSAGEDAAGSIILSDEQTKAMTDMVLQSAASIPDDYNVPSEIPVYQMTRFLYSRMQGDGVSDTFARSEDSAFVKVPIERVREYAAAYFGLPEIKVDFASHRYFDGQFITIPNPDAQPEDGEEPLSYAVNRVEPGAGRVNVTVDVSSGDVLYQRRVYTLRANRDGNITLFSMIARPVEFGLYAINNASSVVSSIMDVPVNSMTAGDFRFQPFGERMLCMISNGKSLHIGYLDLETGKSDQYITIDNTSHGGAWSVQTAGEQVFVFQGDRVTVLDNALLTRQIIRYPEALLSRCDEYTTQFLLSPDLRYLAYTNAAGLQFFSIYSNDSILMQSHSASASDPLKPDSVWEPVAFIEGTGDLLAKLRKTSQEQGFDRLATFSTRNPNNALVSSVRIRGDGDTLLSVRDDRLLLFAPSSVRLTNVTVETPLEETCVDYNLVTGTARAFAASFPLTGGVSPGGNLFLTPDYLYRTQEIRIGEDMVSSLSVQATRNPLDNQPGGRLPAADFGYVDRGAALSILAASSDNRLVALCSGLFCQEIVVI